MRRIGTGTREADKHGPGRDGFTDGDAETATPPTLLNADWFDAAQEEVCRAVENSGDELDEGSFNQLDDAIQGTVSMVATPQDTAYVLHGLQFTVSTVSLNVTLGPGEFVFNRRRYVVTADKLVAASADAWTLPASRDSYFFIAPEDPSDPQGNRETVHVETLDVAIDAAPPAVPAGTLLFLRVRTDGSGVPLGTNRFVYYNRGPRIQAENGAAVELVGPSATAASLRPVTGNAVDLGSDPPPDSNAGSFRNVRAQRQFLRTSISGLFTAARNETYTFVATTSGGGQHDESIGGANLISAANLPNGATCYIEARGAAFNIDNPVRGYAFRNEAIVIKGTTDITLDATGPADFEAGTVAIANGVTTLFVITSNILRLRLTGHTADAMRWFVQVQVIVAGD